MYGKLGPDELKKFLKVDENYRVDALLTFGTYVKSKAYLRFENSLTALRIKVKKETIQNNFFSNVRVVTTAYGRLWFDAIYGCAYASELAHFASVLGAKAIIHIGSFGALKSEMKTGDIIIPSKAYGEESVTRMYRRENAKLFVAADESLCKELAESISIPYKKDESVISIQAMMAETAEDLDDWSGAGYTGVEMECAGLFSVAEHFGVPAAAIMCVADNLVDGSLVTNLDYAASLDIRETSMRRMMEAAIKSALGRMRK